MNKKLVILFFSLFFLSRILFTNTENVFFDSGENIGLFAYPNYFEALISGHFPPHMGYVAIFWPVWQLANLFSSTPTLFVIIGHIILGALTIFCFYKVINYLTDKRTALIAAIIASLLPLFWITNVTIMMEIGYISFFFFSFYLLISYLTSKKQIFLHLSAICFSLAFLTHMLTVLWLPLLLLVVFYKKKKELLKIFLVFSGYLAFISIFKVLLIAGVSKESLPAVFQHLYLSKGGEIANLPFNLHGFLVGMRNFILPLVRNNTSLIFILSVISLLFLFKKDRKLFVLGLLWILPAAFTNQWWDSLLNGRHALITSFGFAFLTAYLLRKNILAVSLVILYLLFVSLPIMLLLTKPIPYLQEAAAVESLPKDGLLIETHFARPQVQNMFDGKLFFVSEPGFDKVQLAKDINSYLSQNKPVFISSGALSEPYGLYSGPYLHNISLSYAKPFELQTIITNYTVKHYQTINVADHLIIYQIVSSAPSSYPQIQSLRQSYRRLDYYDPIWRIYLLLTKQKTHVLF